MSYRKLKCLVCVLTVLTMLASIWPLPVTAKDISLEIDGSIYEFADDTYYEISENAKTDGESIGTLSVKGNMRESGNQESYKKYIVNNGLFTISYEFDQNKLDAVSTEWHIVDDKSKRVDGHSLNENILSGAVIVQSSRDGQLWQTDAALTDVFTADSVLKEPVFKANDIQLQNGCYYRIIVAYKMEKQLESSKVLGFTKENFEYKKIAEVYEFYAVTGEESKASSPEDKPRKELGATVKTELDEGYTGVLEIDKDDPHFDMSIGTFVINGYTRETAEDGTPIFLKSAGDNVSLWFTLSQDITRLKGQDNLSISEDKNGYEIHTNPNLSIPQTNMKRGALIVRHTNNEGHTTVTPYFDFLAANARTTANTKILLREEGDYEISLLYQIEKCDIQIGSLKVIPSYTNYKINFNFKIRNSNAMVFPFDSNTGKELSDKELTPNGFKLDLAKSQYLTIDVEYSVINIGKDGELTTDVRRNRAAKEGTIYTDEGIYTITAKNLYADGEPTVKTIYVGSNKYLMAMSKGYSIEMLNSLIRDGAIVEDDGTIAMQSAPVETTEPPQEEMQNEPTTTPTETITLETTESPIPNNPGSTQKNKDESGTFYIVYGAAFAAIIGTTAFVILKKKKVSHSMES